MSDITTYVHDGITYRIGDRVVCIGRIIGAGDRDKDNYIGKEGVIDQFDDGDTESDDEVGLVRVTFDDNYWWMKPGTNIRLYHRPKGLVLNPKRKMSL